MILGTLILAAACVAVDGERILLSDVSKTVPAFSAAPADEAIGLTPSPGTRRIVGPAEIGRLAARFGVQVAPGAGAGACFERAAEPLTEERVLEAVRGTLQNGPGSWKLIDFHRYPVPRGEIEFFPPQKVTGNAPVYLRGRIRYGTNRSFPIWARVAIKVPPRDVERGDVVSVEVSSGAALIKLDARAESGGNQGEAVVVRNPTTKTCFSALVAGRGKVTLDAKQSTGAGGRGGRREPGR